MLHILTQKINFNIICNKNDVQGENIKITYL
jgi:hypothetical protein